MPAQGITEGEKENCKFTCISQLQSTAPATWKQRPQSLLLNHFPEPTSAAEDENNATAVTAPALARSSQSSLDPTGNVKFTSKASPCPEALETAA